MNDQTQNTIDLTPFGITRPEKIRWVFPPSDDVLSAIKSKSLRKFLQNADEALKNNGISVEYTPLTSELYETFLAYYIEKMTEQNKNIVAEKNWFNDKKNLGAETRGWFYRQNEKLVGVGIEVENDKMVSLAFKASDRLDLSSRSNSNLGSIIEFIFLRKAQSKKNKMITGGGSRNGFGFYNTLGYLESKIKLGYVPHPRENAQQLLSTPIDAAGNCLFLGIDQNSQESFYKTKDDLAFQTEFITHYGFTVKKIS